MNEYKRGIVLRAIMDAGVNLSQAARTLSVHRNTLDRLCRDLDIHTGQLRKNWQTASLMAEEAAVLVARMKEGSDLQDLIEDTSPS